MIERIIYMEKARLFIDKPVVKVITGMSTEINFRNFNTESTEEGTKNTELLIR